MNVTETTSKKMKRQWEIQFFFNFTQRPEVTHKSSKSSDMALKKEQRLMGASLLSSSDDQQTEKQLKIQTMHII